MDGRKKKGLDLTMKWGNGSSRDLKEWTSQRREMQPKASSVQAESHQGTLSQLHRQDRE